MFSVKLASIHVAGGMQQVRGVTAVQCRARGRRSVVVEANFFSRISRITRSFVDGISKLKLSLSSKCPNTRLA